VTTVADTVAHPSTPTPAPTSRPWNPRSAHPTAHPAAQKSGVFSRSSRPRRQPGCTTHATARDSHRSNRDRDPRPAPARSADHTSSRSQTPPPPAAQAEPEDPDGRTRTSPVSQASEPAPAPDTRRAKPVRSRLCVERPTADRTLRLSHEPPQIGGKSGRLRGRTARPSGST
jgi:hypothetical protein